MTLTRRRPGGRRRTVPRSSSSREVSRFPSVPSVPLPPSRPSTKLICITFLSLRGTLDDGLQQEQQPLGVPPNGLRSAARKRRRRKRRQYEHCCRKNCDLNVVPGTHGVAVVSPLMTDGVKWRMCNGNGTISSSVCVCMLVHCPGICFGIFCASSLG